MNLREGILFALEHGPRVRGDIMWVVDRPWTTIYDNLKILESMGKVKRYGVPNGQGRPPVYWELVENGLDVVVEK